MDVQGLLGKLRSPRALALVLGSIASLVAALPAHAERPMAVDDAVTPQRGEGEIEFGWARDDKKRGFEGSVAYVPLDRVKVEIGFAAARDRANEPDARLREAAIALKWVPLQADTGLSAGLALEYARERARIRDASDEISRASAVTGLATWSFASGRRVHLNLGREWERVAGESGDSNTWGIGVEQPLTERLIVGAEVFGAQDESPDRQIGLRYEIVDGLSVSAAVGRGNDRGFGNVGLAWEF